MNGQRNVSSTTYNSVVTFTCDEGYKLLGNNSRTCQLNELWSGSVPQCERMLMHSSTIGKHHCYYHTHILLFTAVCNSLCQNGGKCTGPDPCMCDVGWTGIQRIASFHRSCWKSCICLRTWNIQSIINHVPCVIDLRIF